MVIIILTSQNCWKCTTEHCEINYFFLCDIYNVSDFYSIFKIMHSMTLAFLVNGDPWPWEAWIAGNFIIKCMYMHIKEKFGHSSTGPSSNEKPINSYNSFLYDVDLKLKHKNKTLQTITLQL